MMRVMFLLFLALTVAPAGYALEPLPEQPPIPQDNPMSAAKVALGRALYFDPRLSVDGTISCNSCHNLMKGGDDSPSPVSEGVGGQLGARNSPTVWNAAFMSVLFWDGRANSLEEQAQGPMTNPVEMGNPNVDAVVARLNQIPLYRKAFQRVFGGGDALSAKHLTQAIAAFERTLITPNSRFDLYLKGNKSALSDEEMRGMQKFEGMGCASCHSGPNFAGPLLPAGQGYYEKFPKVASSGYEKQYHLSDDLGRFNVTHKEEDKHMFRVPTLRNIARTAPYFHNGSVATLEEAVLVMGKTQLNKDLGPEDVKDLVAFLKTLTGH